MSKTPFVIRIEMSDMMHVEFGSKRFEGLKGNVEMVASLLETCDTVDDFFLRLDAVMKAATEEAKQLRTA